MTENLSAQTVAAVSRSEQHGFCKQPQPYVELVTGEGIACDAHCGVTTQHLYRKRRTPSLPNFCQVHLLGEELLAELAAKGFPLTAGQFGENILTRGVDLLSLPLHTVLHLGADAVVQVTGLRTPCSQIDAFRPGLQWHCWGPRDDAGKKTRRAGIMSIVLRSGIVKPGDSIRIELPPPPHQPLPAV